MAVQPLAVRSVGVLVSSFSFSRQQELLRTPATIPLSLASKLRGFVHAPQHDLGEAIVCGAVGGWGGVDGGGGAVDFAFGGRGVSDAAGSVGVLGVEEEGGYDLAPLLSHASASRGTLGLGVGGWWGSLRRGRWVFEDVPVFDFFAGPGGFAEELEAGADGGIKLETADANAVGHFFPTMFFNQVMQNGFQGDAV